MTPLGPAMLTTVDGLTELIAQARSLIIEWCDAREAIFTAERATSEHRARLNAAEHALMAYARMLK